jgi:hypothetical protein
MKKLFILLTVLLVLGTSCEDFLTVNEKNPNTASAVPASLILPAALNATADNISQPDNYSFVYLWYGWWSVSGGYSQSPTLTQYKPLNSSWQGNWSSGYTNLQNYDYIDKTAKGAINKPYRAVAKIMKAYIFQNLVDTYGNIPYSEALKTDQGILKPEYDDQQEIYEKLVVELDSAMQLIDELPADAAELGDYDIVYGGDMDLWWKFANTLKLRMLINQTAISGRTTYITSALATTPHTTADYLGAGEGAWVNPGFLQSSGKMNPFWENFYKQDGSQQPDGLGYYVAGQDMCDFLTANNDPRKFRFFAESSAGSGQVLGNYFGQLVLRSVPTTSKLGPGMLQSFNQDAPLMTDFEALFLQAEAVQRGLITGSTAKALYETAVTESIVHMGGIDGTSASAATYLAQAKSTVNWDIATDKVKLIITQKWCALNGLTPMPMWADWRRTGYPDFLHFTQDAARQNVTPPVRLLYPQTEINVNNDNVKAQGEINIFTSKIFWDAN